MTHLPRFVPPPVGSLPRNRRLVDIARERAEAAELAAQRTQAKCQVAIMVGMFVVALVLEVSR